MTMFSRCERCGCAVESAIHVVRDCSFAHTVWKAVLPIHTWSFFFNLPLERWLAWNVKNEAPGWIKINVDGSVSVNRLHAAVSEVFRRSEGEWVVGFEMRIGMLDIFQVKARDVLEGLKLAWARGFRLESDNAFLFDIIWNGFAATSNIVERESNMVTDYTAKEADNDASRLIILEEPPLFVRHIVEEDKRQAPRL
ncbi:hypothetical protein Gorai_019880, partial [Gossypium raimondii]|nr:hypothetical protein [Gossypium raimondii]